MKPMLFVARQPIFDARNTVRSYEILYRANGHEHTAANAGQEGATLKVVSSLLRSPDHGFRDAYVVINASPGFLRTTGMTGPNPWPAAAFVNIGTFSFTSEEIHDCAEGIDPGKRINANIRPDRGSASPPSQYQPAAGRARNE